MRTNRTKITRSPQILLSLYEHFKTLPISKDFSDVSALDFLHYHWKIFQKYGLPLKSVHTKDLVRFISFHFFCSQATAARKLMCSSFFVCFWIWWRFDIYTERVDSQPYTHIFRLLVLEVRTSKHTLKLCVNRHLSLFPGILGSLLESGVKYSGSFIKRICKKKEKNREETHSIKQCCSIKLSVMMEVFCICCSSGQEPLAKGC